MAEGDTLYRIAAGLRPHLVGRPVIAARTTSRAQVARLVGTTIESIETVGKNLLIHFSGGLTVRTHLRMRGAWHTYPPGGPWRHPAARAVLVLEVDGAVAVCFDAPIVELFATRSIGLHPVFSRLGPDLLNATFDPGQALARFREAHRATTTIAEVLLDQTVIAGVGNVFRSEILFVEGVAPSTPVGTLGDALLARLVATARTLLLANVGDRRPGTRTTTGGAREASGGPLWVYGRAGRPCRRCRTLIRAAPIGRDLPRSVWWCPRCQPSNPEQPPSSAKTGSTGASRSSPIKVPQL